MHHIRKTTPSYELFGGQLQGSEESADEAADLPLPAESLEKDEELKMHLLGANSFFTQSVPQCVIVTIQQATKRD
jgi:hypothetical protein